jgi:hypothetical protein
MNITLEVSEFYDFLIEKDDLMDVLYIETNAQ